jgi:hypothetical protein
VGVLMRSRLIFWFGVDQRRARAHTHQTRTCRGCMEARAPSKRSGKILQTQQKFVATAVLAV